MKYWIDYQKKYGMDGKKKYGMAESQKRHRRVGIADRKVFARPESFCAYLQNYP